MDASVSRALSSSAFEDCQYLLLDTITGTSSVPEPRFYGILLAGLLGLVGMFVHNRKRVTE